MLKGIDPLLTPDLLWILAAMGHGDELAVVDALHPAETIARATATGRLVRLPGVTMGRSVEAILSVLPIDSALPGAIRRMEVVGDPGAWPAVHLEVRTVVERHAPHAQALPGLERFAFYEAARAAFAVVQVGDARPYGNFLLRKGALPA